MIKRAKAVYEVGLCPALGLLGAMYPGFPRLGDACDGPVWPGVGGMAKLVLKQWVIPALCVSSFRPKTVDAIGCLVIT